MRNHFKSYMRNVSFNQMHWNRDGSFTHGKCFSFKFTALRYLQSFVIYFEQKMQEKADKKLLLFKPFEYYMEVNKVSSGYKKSDTFLHVLMIIYVFN